MIINKLNFNIMRVHYLKTLTPYYERVFSGQKNFEVRINDRDFQVGDIAVLQNYDPKNAFNDQNFYTKITYVLNGGQFGIEQGYCVFGFIKIEDNDEILEII